jgi:hypothetical protein
MLVMAAFGALIEIVQLIPMLHRDSDWHDWVADVFAVVIALGCFALYQRVAAPQQD